MRSQDLESITDIDWSLDDTDWPIVIYGPKDGNAETVCIINASDTKPGSVLDYGRIRAKAHARLIEAAPAMYRELARLESTGIFEPHQSDNPRQAHARSRAQAVLSQIRRGLQ